MNSIEQIHENILSEELQSDYNMVMKNSIKETDDNLIQDPDNDPYKDFNSDSDQDIDISSEISEIDQELAFLPDDSFVDDTELLRDSIRPQQRSTILDVQEQFYEDHNSVSSSVDDQTDDPVDDPTETLMGHGSKKMSKSYTEGVYDFVKITAEKIYDTVRPYYNKFISLIHKSSYYNRFMQFIRRYQYEVLEENVDIEAVSSKDL
jgi:hypothetical protein